MSVLIRQELFKLYKKKSTFILFAFIALIMILISILIKVEPEIFDPYEIFASAYAAFPWIVFIMIIQASTIITMEFQYGTLKNLLYRSYSRANILISKWITLFLYSISMYMGSLVIAILLKIFMSPDMSFSHKINEDMNVIQALLYNALGNFIGLWLIISLVLLLSCIFKSNGVSVIAGIIFYFAASMVSGVMFLAIEKWEWLKWNPINMLNLSTQISAGELLEPMTRLSINQLFIGNIIYIIIFLLLVYSVFRKKSI